MLLMLLLLLPMPISWIAIFETSPSFIFIDPHSYRQWEPYIKEYMQFIHCNSNKHLTIDYLLFLMFPIHVGLFEKIIYINERMRLQLLSDIFHFIALPGYPALRAVLML